MEALSREFRVVLLWRLLYADDLVVTVFKCHTECCPRGWSYRT